MNINSHLHFINKRRSTKKNNITFFSNIKDMKSNGIMYVYDDDNDDDEKEFFFCHSCVLILYVEGLCGWRVVRDVCECV